MILLDTCTLLWLTSDQSKLSKEAIRVIRENAGCLFISSFSAFEIALKTQKGKLSLPMNARIWFEKVIQFHGIREIPVNSTIAIHSINLPPLHNDPCDRIIIATAKVHTMPIVTCDELISRYQEVKVVW